MVIFLGLIIIPLLFAGSFFWSLSEIALTNLSKYRIKKLIAINKALAVPLGEWLRSPYYLLTTILVGNTVTNLTLGFVGTIVLITAFSWVPRPIVEFFAWISVTLTLVIFGELIPKIVGRMYSEKVTLNVLPILSRIEKVTRPLGFPFRILTKALFPKWDMMPPVSRLKFLSLEEIKVLISEANKTGMLEKDTTQMLERVIQFGDLDVSKIMQPVEKIEGVKYDPHVELFLDLVYESGHSRVPVFDEEGKNIIGFVYTKDLLSLWKDKKLFTRELIRPPYFIKQDKKVNELLKEFQSGQTHMAFVQDALGNLSGIVTLEDVLQEIVGEVLDDKYYRNV